MNEYRPGGFQILPPVVKNLLIINVAVFLALNLTGDRGQYFILEHFALFNWKSPFFRPWQLLTHMFMHQDFLHLLFNMFGLWMFGNVIENVLGTKKFIFFYLICGIGAAVCYLSVQTLMNGNLYVPMLGASGAIYGILFAFGYLFPEAIVIVVVIPMKAKYAVACFAAVELFNGIRNSPADNVAHFAHIGGMIFAYLLLVFWKKSKRTVRY